jgi:hypothetical protein
VSRITSLSAALIKVPFRHNFGHSRSLDTGQNTDTERERREKDGKVQVRIFRCVGNSGRLYRLLEKKKYIYMAD